MVEGVEILKSNLGQDDPSGYFFILIHILSLEMRTSRVSYPQGLLKVGLGSSTSYI